jgi:hemoglobin-like flavoprotein
MPLNVAVLEQTLAQLRPNGARFAADFYARLFAAYPGVRPLFAATDMAAQRRKLMDSMALVVEQLKQGEALASSLRRLGAKHAGWNVLPEHYVAVRQVLLDSLALHLGPRWTPAVRQAWADGYAAVTAMMLAPLAPGVGGR